MQLNNHMEEAVSDVEAVAAATAPDVDARGAFPRETVDALARSGLLALASAAEVGGGGLGPRAAAHVIERLAHRCGSSAMVTLMHYCATAVIEAYGTPEVRGEIAAGRHLTTLAFSEVGSRSHFWSPLGSARQDDGGVRLSARKSWVTAAGQADSYVWSSKPMAADGASTLWLMPAKAPGLRITSGFDGLGMRGNDSRPAEADNVSVPMDARLGPDGGGFGIMMTVVLPWFTVLNAACSLGIMEATMEKTAAHTTATRLEHLDQRLADQPTTQAHLARMRLRTDETRALLDDTLSALEGGREDATLRVLEIKAAAGEAAMAVTDLAMRVCGGAAFRKDVGVERHFRDSRAATVMAPTTDMLYGFIGKVACGLPLFD